MTSQEIRGFASRAGFGILECMKYRASIAALVAAALAVRAQYTPDEMLKPHVYTNAAGATLAYRMSAPQFPEPGKRYPLILFLHGSGECGDDNLKQIKVGLPALMASNLEHALYGQIAFTSGWGRFLYHGTVRLAEGVAG